MRLLIVDDERYVREDMCRILPWTALGILEVSTAGDLVQAQAEFWAKPVDILICDIEMPGGNGIELLQWVRQEAPHTEALFLTCHADFQYAKEALRLNCHDYLLKPVDERELEGTVKRLIARIGERRHEARFRQYGDFWLKQQPFLVERFWLDVINQVIPPIDRALREAAERRHIPLDTDRKVMPLVLSVRRWEDAEDLEDEKALEYGLKNMAEEVFLEGDTGGIFFFVRRGLLLGILTTSRDEEAEDRGPLRALCGHFVAMAVRHLHGEFAHFAGTFVKPAALAAETQRMLAFERRQGELLAGLQGASGAEVAGTGVARGPRQGESSAHNADVVLRVKGIVQDHLHAELSRDDIAARVYLNADYLDRLFRRREGVTVSQYAAQLRLDRARQLLEGTDRSIGDIGETLGYGSISSFSNMFRKACNESPLEYRRRMQGTLPGGPDGRE